MIERQNDSKRVRDALKRSRVIYPGEKRYALARKIEAVPLADFVGFI